MVFNPSLNNEDAVSRGIFVSDNYTSRFAYDANGNMAYLGWARPGADESKAVWKIAIQEFDAEGRMIARKYADGDLHFDNVWTNRAALNYL
jgi:hypothetical protein